MNAGLSALLDFVRMDGYALFVWGSLGMCALVMLAEVIWLRHRHASLLDGRSDDSVRGES